VPLGRGERVLLVDDEEMVVLTARRLLERLGYVVTAYASSAAALAAFSAAPERFDIVVSDLTMPGLTGTELSEAVRRARPDVPIVLATGHLEQLDLERAQALGVSEMLPKPFDTQLLARAMRRALA
jgi:CheY-like chemotaxis protein